MFVFLVKITQYKYVCMCVHVCIYICIILYNVMYVHVHVYILTDAFLYWYPTGDSPQYTADNVQTVFRNGGGSLIPHPQTYVHVHVHVHVGF